MTIKPGLTRLHKGIQPILVSVILLLSFDSRSVAQVRPGIGEDHVTTLVNTVTVMPYLTGSLNLFSGKAFPASATGVGFGGGLEFDLTDPGQKSGLLFDFAFQDMRGAAQNGGCVIPGFNPGDTNLIIEPANAYHYWEYILFEPYLKLSGAKDGYLLLGLSLGYAILAETYNQPASGQSQATLWNGTPVGNAFRLDVRAGIGVKLRDIGTHQLMLEVRAGYPVTNVISNYSNVCTGGDVGGWRIITIQANLGLRV